jgi:hypothetical protein
MATIARAVIIVSMEKLIPASSLARAIVSL